jgi:transcriptional regulator with XRE-family HTH domain
MDARDQFAANVRAERKRLELSQEALGYLCDLNMSEISRLERAQRDPRLATIVKLARALQIPPAQLLEGISWTSSDKGEPSLNPSSTAPPPTR